MSLRLMSAVVSSSTEAHHRQDRAPQLLAHLLECVQACQKRYGGKTELATEFDSCIIALCFTLESVLRHGLRPKPLDSTLSAFQQVSDLVTTSLHLAPEPPSFWCFLRQFLTSHEIDRYIGLKQVWTDTGRAKAWLRSALNERCLERYLHSFFARPDLLEVYYDSDALLRDPEAGSLLPNMAAGLGSILFAISIDKPELNSGLPTRAAVGITRTEPIIEAPLPSEHVKKRRKVARQFISFEEDDLPSSSGSDLSIEKKMNEIRRKEESKAIKTLTPVNSGEIGELTPISSSVDEASDISAVLSDIEAKNSEELAKRDERIEQLEKENVGLKEQIKKYLEAIQMLRRDDEGLQRALEGLQVGAQPDYKGEAKLFERKLVQVAEMHAELMDFNVSLQQSLLKKESALEKLKAELDELRGPMPGLSEDEKAVCVWIPSAFLSGSGSNAHHVYQVFLKAGNDEWNIYRRYSQFYELNSDLKKLDPAVGSFSFPPKKTIGRRDEALVEERRKRLQVYLRKVLAHWPELANCNSRFLLEQHLAFFKNRKEDEIRSRESVLLPGRNNASSDNHYTGL